MNHKELITFIFASVIVLFVMNIMLYQYSKRQIVAQVETMVSDQMELKLVEFKEKLAKEYSLTREEYNYEYINGDSIIFAPLSSQEIAILEGTETYVKTP